MMFARIAPPAGTHRLGAAQAKPPIPLRLGPCHAPQLARVQERSGTRADAMEIFLHASFHDPVMLHAQILLLLSSSQQLSVFGVTEGQNQASTLDFVQSWAAGASRR
jgi:hypothetical protein